MSVFAGRHKSAETGIIDNRGRKSQPEPATDPSYEFNGHTLELFGDLALARLLAAGADVAGYHCLRPR